MSESVISGGKPLFGTVIPGGSKNAALPILFACLPLRAVSVISNVPDIGDVRVAIEILCDMGASVVREGDVLTVDTTDVFYKKPRHSLTSRIRASSYLIGASLAAFGIFHLSEFGGCNFGNRPIDMHLYAAERLGAKKEGDAALAGRLRGARIAFSKKSVGATINALIMAAFAEGETYIEGGAEEPHVGNLIEFLRSAGADIEAHGGNINVRSRPSGGGRVTVIADMIEAGTFLIAAPLTGGRITASSVSECELSSLLSVLSASGISVECSKSGITVFGEPSREFCIRTEPYPGYPTDLQPQIAPLMAKFFGGDIYEGVWHSRFSYLSELRAFGIGYEVSGSRAKIFPSALTSGIALAPDLRGGAAALLAALAAEGESRIKNTEIILRGYSQLERKLTTLGADIKIDETNLQGDT
ncbi:MAG: UDP-N-acetylglucosamine 1-carboxyvinyltransferase [Clostridia bacterium]|nr:UDP-N-acetylglucosamine 1-carboxyvinyltransferase [Clostridia bacterium]